MRKPYLIVILILCDIFTCIIPVNGVVTTGDDQQQNSGTHEKSEKQESTDQGQSNQPGTSYQQHSLENSQLSNQDSEEEQEYEPFIVVTSPEGVEDPLHGYFTLPTKFLGEGKELKLAAGQAYHIEISLCPDIRIGDLGWEKELSTLRKDIPSTASCLFIPPSEVIKRRMCTEEPQAWLQMQKTRAGEPVICGDNEKHILLSSQYNNCGTDADVIRYNRETRTAEAWNKNLQLGIEEKEMPGLKIKHYKMYEICFDYQHKQTLWTRHEVNTPALLAHKYYPYNSLNTSQLKDFITNGFELDVKDTPFIKLKTAYESAEGSMGIYTMVPKVHMALPYWKKATTHFINSAPLLPEFAPLMEAIHNGIFLASYYWRTTSTVPLKIYTKADTMMKKTHTIASNLHLTGMLKAMKPEKSTDVFLPNTWYILVYNKEERSGILIVLHNIRETAPTTTECTDNVTLPCEFETWSNKPESITDRNPTYAYCCPVSKEKIQKLFPRQNLRIDENLELQNFINLARKIINSN